MTNKIYLANFFPLVTLADELKVTIWPYSYCWLCTTGGFYICKHQNRPFQLWFSYLDNMQKYWAFFRIRAKTEAIIWNLTWLQKPARVTPPLCKCFLSCLTLKIDQTLYNKSLLPSKTFFSKSAAKPTKWTWTGTWQRQRINICH